MLQPGLRPEISQGDIFDGIQTKEVFGGREESHSGLAVLLSHDCEFDKPNHPDVLVARVLPLAAAPESTWAAIRDGSAYHVIHLPSVGQGAEAYINLRYIHRVLKDDLRAAATAGRRMASMTDDGRTALIAYLFRFFSRRLPA